MNFLTIILLFFLIIIIFYLYQSQRVHGPVINFLIILAVLFLILSIGFFFVNSSSNLSNFNGVLGFIKGYFSWLISIVDNGSQIVGYVINQDWGLNSTFSPSKK